MYPAYIRDHLKELIPDAKIRSFVLKSGKPSEATQLVSRTRQYASPRAASPGYDAAALFKTLQSTVEDTCIYRVYRECTRKRKEV